MSIFVCSGKQPRKLENPFAKPIVPTTYHKYNVACSNAPVLKTTPLPLGQRFLGFPPKPETANINLITLLHKTHQEIH
jgi:hypothetical protein